MDLEKGNEQFLDKLNFEDIKEFDYIVGEEYESRIKERN